MSITQISGPASRSGLAERAYLLRRAEDHRQLAEKTGEPGRRVIHERFQRLYEERAALIVVLAD